MSSLFKKSLWLNIALGIVLVSVAWGAARMTRTAIGMHQEVQANQKKIEELSEQKRALEASLRELQTREAAEREGKERFNLKKPGEEVIVVVPDEPEKHLTDTASETPLWQKVQELFR